jgi:hypothetical protein
MREFALEFARLESATSTSKTRLPLSQARSFITSGRVVAGLRVRAVASSCRASRLLERATALAA